MENVGNREYKVLLTHKRLGESAGDQQWCWQATVLGFPAIVEQAVSREQVITQIRERIDELTRNSEVITLTAPVLPRGKSSAHDELAVEGWNDYGLFKDDPDALTLFDDIEEERNRHMVGGA